MIGLFGGGLSLLAATAPDVSTAPAVLSALAVTSSPLELAVGTPVGSPDPLADPRAEIRASRDRRPAAVPEPEPAPSAAAPVPAPAPATPPLPGCDAEASDTGQFANGRVPDRVLCALPGGSGEQLRADAAVAFVGLAQGYQQAMGKPICLTDGYRTLGEQEQLARTKPRLAARPGTSEHGWGVAVDLGCGIQSFRTAEHSWMVQNADRYGWFLPAWAQRSGSKPEPWHWEYGGA